MNTSKLLKTVRRLGFCFSFVTVLSKTRFKIEFSLPHLLHRVIHSNVDYKRYLKFSELLCENCQCCRIAERRNKKTQLSIRTYFNGFVLFSLWSETKWIKKKKWNGPFQWFHSKLKNFNHFIQLSTNSKKNKVLEYSDEKRFSIVWQQKKWNLCS